MSPDTNSTDTALINRRKRLVFRAWHRGVKEADIIIGTFVKNHVDQWGTTELAWFEHLLEETDRDILSWIMKSAEVPEIYDTPILHAMQKLDYVTLPR